MRHSELGRDETASQWASGRPCLISSKAPIRQKAFLISFFVRYFMRYRRRHARRGHTFRTVTGLPTREISLSALIIDDATRERRAAISTRDAPRLTAGRRAL